MKKVEGFIRSFGFYSGLAIFLTFLMVFLSLPQPLKVFALGSPSSSPPPTQANWKPPTVNLPNSLPAPKISTFSVDPTLQDTDIQSLSGKIAVHIPKGAASVPLDIQITEYTPTQSTGMQLLNLFQLTAIQTGTTTKITQFAKGLGITIKHTAKDLAGLDQSSLGLYYLDEKTNQWVQLGNGQLAKSSASSSSFNATTTHFSYFGEQAAPTITGPGRVLASQVNMASGDLTFNYPIELPAGPGGFTPSLALNYNSGTVNEMKSKYAVGSWVGIGWNLSLGRITYSAAQNQYFLDLNSCSYQIYSADGTNFHTNPESYFKIVRSTQDPNKWDCWDKDGMYYCFGGTTTSEQYDSGVYYRWDCSSFSDTNNNQATITYAQDKSGTAPNDWVKAAYPASLDYGSMHVTFATSTSRLDVPSQIRIGEDRKLTSITIKVGTTVIRKYSFSYNTVNASSSTDYGGTTYAGALTLTSITQSDTAGTLSLPAMGFYYNNLEIYRNTNETSYVGNPGNPASITWPFLSQINSGYGGYVQVQYTETPTNTSQNIWTRECVVSKTTYSGIDSGQASYYSYLTNPEYAGVGWDQQWKGFQQVKETDSAGNYIIHYFYTTGTATDGKDADKLSGKEYKTEWYSPSGTLLQQKVYDFSATNTSQDYELASTWGSTGSIAGTVAASNGIVVAGDGSIYISDYGQATSVERVQKFNSQAQYVSTIGSSSIVDGKLNHPAGVAHVSQNCWVVDQGNNRIVEYDASGNYVMEFGSCGIGNGQLDDPSDILIKNNAIFVADTGNNRIEEFDTSGNYVAQFGSYGSGNGQLNAPTSMAIDNSGYLYILDSGNNRVCVFYLTNGSWLGSYGTQGSGVGQFNSPKKIFCNSAGLCYVSDSGNNRIQMLSYVMGNFNSSGQFGTQGSGNGQFNDPEGVWTDGTTIYVADTGNNRIQSFTTSGTFISSWGTSGSGDGQFNHPCGITATGVGNTSIVWVSDQNNNRVQVFTAFLTKWYGQFTASSEIALDSSGNVYVSYPSGNKIQKFDSGGNSILVWGVAGSGNGQFSSPTGIAVDGNGNVFVVDSGNHRVQKFDSGGSYIAQWAMPGSSGFTYGIAIDPNGNVYVADAGNGVVNKYDSSGNYVTGLGGFSGAKGIAVDSSGNVYVADTLNHRIKKFNSSGTYQSQFTVLTYPSAVAVDANGNIFVSDRNYPIEEYSSSYTLIARWGTYSTSNTADMYFGYYGIYSGLIGIALDSSDDVYAVDPNGRIQEFQTAYLHSTAVGESGPLANGQFNTPQGVVLDSSGNIYIVDKNNFRIQKFNSSGAFVTTWGTPGTGDGQFLYPRGVAVDSNGNVYVADTGNNRIQKFSSSGTYITQWGTTGIGNGQFNSPFDVAVSGSSIYVVDKYNNRIQKFSLTGTYQAQWGTLGSGSNQLNVPQGISTDSNGYIYVADTGNGRIIRFDSSGSNLKTWTTGGNPDDMAVSANAIYAVDSVNKSVTEIGFNWITQLNQVDTTQGTKTSRVRYSYGDYGNVITQYNDGDISTNSDDSTVWTLFYPNTTTNILDKPARIRTYAGEIGSDDDNSNIRAETQYYYDGQNTSLSTPPVKGNVTREEQTELASPLNTFSKYYTYDSYGNKLTDQDPDGNQITITYDSTYHTYPATVTYPITGLSESYTYDPGTNNMLTHVDLNGQTTTYQFDTFKRLIKVINPGDSANHPTIQYLYNSYGNPGQQNLEIDTKVDNSNVLWQKQYFDGEGRVIQVQSKGESGCAAISSTTTFNTVGSVDRQYVSQVLQTSQVSGYYTPDSGWQYSSNTYDGLDRTIQVVTDPNGANPTTVSNDYSTTWQTLITNERGYKTRDYYDAFQRLVKVEELNATEQVYSTTTYSYDVLGNLTQVEDNAGNITTMTYDMRSQKITMSDPDMGDWMYGYDSNGNLTDQQDASSQDITFSYDAMNRLTGKTYPQNSGMTNVTYSYDSTAGGNFGKGLRTSMTDAAGTESYKYDTRGRQIEEKRTIGTTDYTTDYTYDSADRVATITYPTGEVVTNGYNSRGLPYSLSGNVAGNLVTSALYNQLGSYTEINLGNTLKTTFGYYGLGGTYDTTGGYFGQLWEIKTLPQGGGTARQDVRYTWDAGGNMSTRQDLVNPETETFSYDFLDRLTAVSGAYTQSYAYNEIGNITSLNGSSYTYSTNQPQAVTSVGSTSYAYDANGNMTDNGGMGLTWDLENRPTIIGNETYVYDGDGNRIEKTVGGVTTLYINKYYELNTGTSTATTSYYLGGKMIATCAGTTLTYIHQDNLGSTSAVTSSTGTLVSGMKFFPFGATRSGSVSTDKKFTGQRLDGTGLYYYNARYYNPAIGRFISPDNLQDVYYPQSLNRYSYSYNNPVKYIDPSGHSNISSDGAGGDSGHHFFVSITVWESQSDDDFAEANQFNKQPASYGGWVWILVGLTTIIPIRVGSYWGAGTSSTTSRPPATFQPPNMQKNNNPPIVVIPMVRICIDLTDYDESDLPDDAQITFEQPVITYTYHGQTWSHGLFYLPAQPGFWGDRVPNLWYFDIPSDSIDVFVDLNFMIKTSGDSEHRYWITKQGSTRIWFTQLSG